MASRKSGSSGGSSEDSDSAVDAGVADRAAGGGASGGTTSSGRGTREEQGSPIMGTTVIAGVTFASKSITYYEVDGKAMVEGDIVLGTIDQIKAITESAQQAAQENPDAAFGVGIVGSQFRWPNCRVPYEIDPALPNQQRVTDAIAHWEANTAIRFPLRTAANAGQYPNYVRFSDQGGCWSMVGMQGGQQTISLGAGCSTGNAIHEIGHTVGLWHEQSREDRDLFVRINWQNIQSGMAAQFNQHITDGDDLGAYDYGSIMHYPRNAFSKNGQDTITPLQTGAQIGQRTGLSAGDIAAVRAMYPNCVSVNKKLVDDRPNFKKISDDVLPVKKIRDDRPPIKKLVDDPSPVKKLRDDRPPIKKISDDPMPKQLGDPPKFDPRPPVVRPGLVTGIGGGQVPFSMATPHHAEGFSETEQQSMQLDPAVAAQLSTLYQELLQAQARLDEVQATSSRAAAELPAMQAKVDALAAAYAAMLDSPAT